MKWIEANGRKWRDRLRDFPQAALEQLAGVLGVAAWDKGGRRRLTKEDLKEAVCACVWMCVCVRVCL